MGWKWVDDDDEPLDSISSPKGLGDLVNPNPRNSMEERSSTRRIVKSSCRTEEVEPGRFIRKCDKTEQILRESLGRPLEVVESKTEHTEDDVTDEVTSGRRPFESSGGFEAFSFPALRSDIESIQRGVFGGLGHFLEAAEEMANGIFQSFNAPSRHSRESSPFGERLPADGRQEEEDGSERTDESAGYSGLAGGGYRCLRDSCSRMWISVQDSS